MISLLPFAASHLTILEFWIGTGYSTSDQTGYGSSLASVLFRFRESLTISVVANEDQTGEDFVRDGVFFVFLFN